MKTQIIAVDWDHTAYQNEAEDLMPGVREAFDRFHDAGYRIMIHSCNNPAWIRKRCEELGLKPDYIWGETGMDACAGSKPVCALYVDDRAQQFTSWEPDVVSGMLERVRERPVRRY
jgi:hydroxymethylpyrimidine pyrophosphatase-like HAD family hydrolase